MYHPGKVIDVFHPKDKHVKCSEGTTQATLEMWDENMFTFLVAENISSRIKPGDIALVDYRIVSEKIPIIPGVSTATEITSALEAGLDVVKFFPADAFGGLKALKALSAPFPMMKFVPTGGIDSVNMIEYLKFPKVLACGGSWMVKSDLIKEKKFDEIQRITHQAVTIAGSVKQ